jgi:hypothetical protein
MAGPYDHPVVGGGGGGSRWWIVALSLAVVGLGAAVWIVLAARSGSGGEDRVAADSASERPSASSDELPPPDPDEAGQTLTYLAGDGKAVLAMHRAAQGLVDELDTRRCTDVATTLDRDAPSDQMAVAIAAVVDEPLATALEAERVSLGTTLTACAKGDPPPRGGGVLPLDEATGIVQARLDALKAVR